MITRRIRHPLSGELVDAEMVEIEKEDNEAIILRLKDGAVLRLRTDIAQVVRVVGFANTDGDPIYRVTSNNVVTLLKPPNDHSA